MAQPRTARGSFLGVAPDNTTYGTAAGTLTHFFRLFTAGITNVCNDVPVGTLADSNNASEVVSAHVRNEQSITGTVEMPLMAEGMGLLIHHAMWATATTGSGPYTHTSTVASSRPALGLTLEQCTGAKSEIFPGGRISKMVLKGEVGGGVLRAAFDVIAQAPTAAPGTPSTPTYTANETASTVEWWRGATASIGGNAYKIQSFEITLDRKLEPIRSVGALVTDDPATSTRPEVMGKFRLAQYDDQLYADYKAGTEANVTLTFTKGTKSIAFTVENAHIGKYAENRGTGPTIIDLEVVGQSDSSDTGLKIVIVNSQSTYSAA